MRCLTGAMLVWVPLALQGQVSGLLTRAEATGWEETSRYEDVMAFVSEVSDASSRIHLTTFGRSLEGRALPLVVVGDVEGPTPAAVMATGKTRVFIQANIHAGEVCGKEAMQMMLRDMAGGAHTDWLDSVVLLIAPIYNADGNERVSLNNRPRQHGPVAGMGQRPNAQGYDLNRDHIKLDSPEARALISLMDRYDPHVGIDLHTTNGTRHGYHITYSPPLHPNTDSRVDDILRNEWLPAAGAYLNDTEGWASFYYGNAGRQRENGLRMWRTFDFRPRFNNNYLGLRNRFAILSEAYSYASFEERVVATLRFVEGAVEWAVANATRIRETTDAVDETDLVGTRLGVRAAPHGTGEVQILMGEVDEVRNPYSGQRMLLRREVRAPETMIDYGSFAVTESATVPAAYLVPARLVPVLDKLTDHGVRMTAATNSGTRAGRVFRIDSTTASAREFQQHRERTVFGEWVEQDVEVEAGDMVVDMRQPLARLIFTLLEPRAADGLANWNVLDPFLRNTTEYPIVQLARPN